MNGQSTADAFKEAAGISIGLAVVMIVLGLLAVGVPLASGIGISILMAWIIVFSGFTYLAYALNPMMPARLQLPGS